MLLSDRELRFYLQTQDTRRRIRIDPYPTDECFQPASIDLRLGRKFIRYANCYIYDGKWTPHTMLDLVNGYDSVLLSNDECDEQDTFTINPGDFVLGHTLENVCIPSDFYGRVEGKSSLGRMGLLVHATAGFIDPGYCGNIILELKNINTIPIRLHYVMKISQLCIGFLTSTPARLYGHNEIGSKYQNSNGVIEAKCEHKI